MIIVGLLIFVLVIIGIFVFVVFGGVLKTESDQKKAESHAGVILDAAFDGRPNVTFNTSMRSLKYETVILGAQERGYKLTHQANGQYGALLFEKTPETTNSPASNS